MLGRHALKKFTEFPPGLDALYARMIDQTRDLFEDDAKLCMQVARWRPTRISIVWGHQDLGFDYRPVRVNSRGP